MTAGNAFDVVIVGAGFSGIYMLERCRTLGLSACVIEAGTGPGGTWYWNRYPGLRCDVESMTYSYSFSDEIQKEWSWTERYATQAEILRYIEYVVDRLDLRRDMRFETRVTRAAFAEAENRWKIETDRGERLSARFCVMATGCLSVPNLPDFEGLERFEGDWYHTADWPRDGVDFTGKRVGVVGTGSSGVQSIPVIAEQAKHLTVFQRTANYSIPAWNHPLDGAAIRRWKTSYPALRQKARISPVGDVFDPPDKSALEVTDGERRQRFEAGWRQGSFGFLSTFNDLLTNQEASDLAAEFVREKIRATVRDPRTAELLCPRDIPIGTKRLCVDTDYYETFNRDNVDLVDISEMPIETITPKGLKVGGVEYALDAIVFATGYDAMTGALFKIDITGRGGVSLRDKWAEGPRTYLGLAIAGFPNLFTVTGPGSPSVISNMMVSIEQHIEWIADCLAYVRERDCATIEATQEAEDRWTRHVGEVADGTLFFKGKSWYIGANIPGKPRVCFPYLGGVGAYREICDRVAAGAYEGFRLAGAPPAAAGTAAADGERQRASHR